MKNLRALVHIVALAAFLISGMPVSAAPGAPPAYLEPWEAAASASADVIVMAATEQAAADAVQAVGGTVFSRLWLVNGVHAVAPAANLGALAAQPGVLSVVRNRRVSPDGAYGFDEYVTSKRQFKAQQAQSDTQVTPAAYLPDGGYVAVDQKGRVLITNADGGTRSSLNLPGSPFLTPPVIAADGTIIIAGQTLRIYALTPNGQIRWQYALTGSSKFLGGAILGADGTVIAADSGRTVYAFALTDGRLLWKYKAGSSGVFKSSPVAGPDGTLYLTTDKGYVYAVDPTPSLKWSYNTAVALNQSAVVAPDGKVCAAQIGGKSIFCLDGASGKLLYKKTTAGAIRANPLAGPDGALYLPSEPGLVAFNPDGSQRFYFPTAGGLFKTTPTLSTDQKTLYIAVEGSNLFALDAATGAQRWVYAAKGKMFASPVVDAADEIIIGTDAGTVEIISPLGDQIDRVGVADKVTQTAAVSDDGDITVRVGTTRLVTIGLPPKHWDGRPDVIPTDNKNYYQLVNPATIDVGVDRLHDVQLTVNSKIRGAGVTIAVVDSGIYFDSETINVLSGRINAQFLGQADFIDRTCLVKPDGTLAGIQYPDHCYTDKPNRQFSRDGYGHGTHMAGVIWSNLYDSRTNTLMGIAPDANIVSVRVLGDDGVGTYATVIEGLQWVVANKDAFQIRVVNLSLSAPAQTPYFADPLNRAVEQAWASGLVVLAAAGNTGPAAESITVPGNDPYVITVGAVSGKRTPGYWGDDDLPSFSASGPTLDGFIKPDILVSGTQIVSFMYNECKAAWAGSDCRVRSQALARSHGDYSATSSLFRMSGTSLSTAIASGVAALMLQAHPELTPDQVKFRMKYSARPAVRESGEPVYSPLQQGYGRLWAPTAVLGTFPEGAADNLGMDIRNDLAHGAGWLDANLDGLVQYDELDPAELAQHYQGPVGKLISDDGNVALYFIESGGGAVVLGAANRDGVWLDRDQLDLLAPTWQSGEFVWDGSSTWTAGNWTWGGGNWTWGGGNWTWGGGNWTWGGGNWTWGGGNWTWGGGWSSGGAPDASTTKWVDD